MEKDERWTIAGAFVREAERVDLDHLHAAFPAAGSTVTFVQMLVETLALAGTRVCPCREGGGQVTV
jgi:hypothetical protein